MALRFLLLKCVNVRRRINKLPDYKLLAYSVIQHGSLTRLCRESTSWWTKTKQPVARNAMFLLRTSATNWNSGITSKLPSFEMSREWGERQKTKMGIISSRETAPSLEVAPERPESVISSKFQGRQASIRQTIRQKAKQPMPEPNELEMRFTKVLVSGPHRVLFSPCCSDCYSYIAIIVINALRRR